MRRISCILCLIILLTGILCGSAGAEETPKEPCPITVVSYDRAALIDWLPSYGLTMPGVLLELTHTEGMLAVTAVDASGRSPEEYLSEQLDRAGDTLSVSNAEIDTWADPFGGDGRVLNFYYTYPAGDEVHLTTIWTAVYQDGILLELSIDTWGAEAETLMGTAVTTFVKDGFLLTGFEDSTQLFATLTDVVESAEAVAHVQLTAPDAGSTEFYPLSADAVVLFPNPDDPSLFYPVAPDTASLVDAILTYEENSDGPATFKVLICEEQIVYMEYSLMQ